jgi:putative ABC transport system substrate-binding protein
MRRRDFVKGISVSAVTWPLGTRAQQTAKLPTVGLLGAATPNLMGPWVAAFVQRLRDLGWTDGRTVTIDVRWAEGRSKRFSEIAAEFVRLKVDLIVTSGAAVLAAKQPTSTIPIVFGVAIDPVGGGLVKSLAKPGGNITGLSIQSTDLAGKRIEILREVVPGIRTLAILGDADYPAAALEMSEVAAIAGKIGLGVAALEVRQPRGDPARFSCPQWPRGRILRLRGSTRGK